MFSPDEVETALELIDEWLAEGEASGYLTYVLEEGRRERKYEGTLFGWLDAAHREYVGSLLGRAGSGGEGKGYGQKLLALAESEVKQREADCCSSSTASQEAYGATVRFYERAGYPAGVADPRLLSGRR